MFDGRMDKRYGRTVTLRLPEQLSLLRSPATEATHAFKEVRPRAPRNRQANRLGTAR